MDNNAGNQEGQLYVVGSRGYSAYEVACQQGFEGTVDEWLESLVGPQGIQGIQGEQGLQGIPGPTPQLRAGTIETLNPGEDVYVNIIGTPANPIMNMGIPKGDKGDTGDTGPIGQTGPYFTPSVDSSGNLSWSNNGGLTNPTTQNIKGPKGDTGDTGPIGQTGETGATGATGNGIVGTEKTSTSGYVDTYTMTYTNGDTDTFTVTNGEVSQAELDETNTELNKYKTIYNVLPKVENETLSSEVELEDTGENAYMDIKPIGKVSQKSLPSEYAAVDYIQSSGTQYIDTNYIINSKTNKIETVFQMVNLDNQYNCVFGYEKTGSNRFFMRYNRNTTTYFTCYTPNQSVHLMESSNKNQIIFDIPNNKLYKNGNEENITITIDSSGLSLYLFGLNYNDGFAMDNASDMRLFSFKIYENDKIVKEYIPCYRKSDNEIGMYDLVNDVFYTNQGTGNFTYGSAVDIPNPDYPIPIKVVTGTNNVKIQNSDRTLEKNYSLNLGNLEMYAGDYFFKNTIDDENYDSSLDLNAWYLKNNWGKVILDGSESWQSDGTIGTNYRHALSLINYSIPTPININFTYLSNYFTATNRGNNADTLGHFYISNTFLVFHDKNGVYDNTTWGTWLSIHNTIVIYQLATPTYTKITDTNLIGQLEAIKNNARSYGEKTYITCTSSSSDNETLQVKAVALADLSNILGGE